MKIFRVIVIAIGFFCAGYSSEAAVYVKKPIRALHLVTRAVSPADVMKLVDIASKEKFNTIILGIAWRGSTKLKSMPWVDGSKAWSSKDLLAVVQYIREKNMQVVPELKLLSHANVLFQKNFPNLMYNSKTYDPRKPEVYQKVFPIIDEVIALLHPQAIHIGHDEVVGWSKRHYVKGLLKSDERQLPANLFLKSVVYIHEHLHSKGVETWMWGDMLISQGEFPSMRKSGALHDLNESYGATLRKKIPRDILICDWHYNDKQRDFPTVSAFKNDGFRVLGATWKKEKTIQNFSYYAAHHGAEGMIATTWFHVQRKEWDIVNNIIKVSGKTFLKDFPDTK